MRSAWHGSDAGVVTGSLILILRPSLTSIEPELLMRAVRKHTDCPWALLYIVRWLKAPMQMADGSLIGRESGTPQGGVISPLLANLFLHYAFDLWMRRNFPDILFERYADDAICHCRDEDQATALRTALETRFAECGLTLHPEKTKIVYCKDQSRRENHPTLIGGVTKAWMISRVCSIHTFVAGSTTMRGSVLRPSAQPRNAST